MLRSKLVLRCISLWNKFGPDMKKINKSEVLTALTLDLLSATDIFDMACRSESVKQTRIAYYD